MPGHTGAEDLSEPPALEPLQRPPCGSRADLQGVRYLRNECIFATKAPRRAPMRTSAP